jgi:hypothetical protein
LARKILDFILPQTIEIVAVKCRKAAQTPEGE